MIDNHVHIGWYTDGYHSPTEVWQAETEAGIMEIAVSSTSTCAELYKLVVEEMLLLKKIGGDNVHPLLWVTPQMMKTWGIRYMLHSKVNWQGVKLHWGAHREWYYNKKLLYKVLALAQEKSLPILLHTGESKECQPSVFKSIINEFSNLSFVLAHGRPIKQTLNILQSCPNTFVDTVFMPIEHISLLIEDNKCDRMLFGTDTPINMVFDKTLSTVDYIKQCLEMLRGVTSIEQFNIITSNTIYKNNNHMNV